MGSRLGKYTRASSWSKGGKIIYRLSQVMAPNFFPYAHIIENIVSFLGFLCVMLLAFALPSIRVLYACI